MTSARQVLAYITDAEDRIHGDEVLAVARQVFPQMTHGWVAVGWRPHGGPPRERWMTLQMRRLDLANNELEGLSLRLPTAASLVMWAAELARHRP